MVLERLRAFFAKGSTGKPGDGNPPDKVGMWHRFQELFVFALKVSVGSVFLHCLMTAARFTWDSVPRKLPPLRPKTQQGKVVEAFNRRLLHNVKGHNVLVIDREETLPDEKKLRARLKRFFDERGLFPLAKDDMAEILASRLKIQVPETEGACCIPFDIPTLSSLLFGMEEEKIFFAVPFPPGTFVEETVQIVCNQDLPGFVVATDLPLSDEGMEHSVLDHEAFGHALDPEKIYESKMSGYLMPQALSELRADISQVVRLVKEHHSTIAARAWAGLRSLGALNRALRHIQNGKAGYVRMDNIYNNGGALDSVVDRLEVRLEDPARAAAFFRMDDDALDALVDEEAAKERFTRGQFLQRAKVLDAAARMFLDGMNQDGSHRVGPQTRRLERDAPELCNPAMKLLRVADAARQYHYVMGSDHRIRTLIRKPHLFPEPAPK
ncbi:MAG TPA: hypothetical protein DCW68_01755 [Rhodospirillaceae bacterium]|nr:MAG: hypothetical protein A2018_04720 [Alphaproteobacteria bacterium GWF2_58_20]HAU28821.1 hypothetical protein [Rhodospirillaceae bacterium]